MIVLERLDANRVVGRVRKLSGNLLRESRLLRCGDIFSSHNCQAIADCVNHEPFMTEVQSINPTFKVDLVQRRGMAPRPLCRDLDFTLIELNANPFQNDVLAPGIRAGITAWIIFFNDRDYSMVPGHVWSETMSAGGSDRCLCVPDDWSHSLGNWRPQLASFECRMADFGIGPSVRDPRSFYPA